MGANSDWDAVLDAFAHESVTIDNTSGGKALTSGTYAPTGARTAQRALLSLEVAQIRFTYDGTAASATVGHLMEIGDRLELVGSNAIAAFRGFRTGAASGTLKVTYER